MRKPELVALVAQQAGLSLAEADTVIEEFTAQVTLALGRSGSLTLARLGSFVVTERRARWQHHPRTGQRIEVAASRGIRFRPATALRQAVLAGGAL